MYINQSHKVILVILIFCFTGELMLSQDRKTHSNYTGNWESPLSWDPAWMNPRTNVNNLVVAINGYITANSSLTFTGSGKLIVEDTLVIIGDLTLNNDNELEVNERGILIVHGNLTFSNKSEITADGYIIVTGNVTKEGTVSEGAFDTDDPVRVFIGGTISPEDLLNDLSDFEALNCLSPSDPYPDSGCSYGNMEDLANDPIYEFFLTTCMNATAGSNSPLCPGETLTLFSSGGSSYSWSGPGDFTSSAQNPAIPVVDTDMTGIYTVTITGDAGCVNEIPVNVIINPAPEIAIKDPSPECYPATADLTQASVTAGSAPGLTWSFHTDPEGTEELAAPHEATTGTWYIKGTTREGCYDLKPVSVIIHPPSYAQIIGTTDTICAGGQSELRFSLQGEGPWNMVYSDGTENFSLEAVNSTHVSYINPTSQDSTTYIYQIVSLTDRFGCQAPANNISGLASLRVYAYPKPDPGYSVEVCGNSIHLNAGPGYGRGVWHSEAATTEFFPGPYHPDAAATVTEYGQHRFTWTETNWQCSASTDIDVAFYEPPGEVYAGYDKVLQFTFETDLEAVIPDNMPEAYGIWEVVEGNGKIDFKNDPRSRVTNLGFGENILLWTIYNGVCEPVSVPVKILVTDLDIPTAFSPNNSGFNDRFIIRGIENSISNKLTVFNRQGNVVFKANNYQNEWDGRNHNGVPLQEDTFFFILSVDNQFSYKGFIILKR